jgi:hypothetical protein
VDDLVFFIICPNAKRHQISLPWLEGTITYWTCPCHNCGQIKVQSDGAIELLASVFAASKDDPCGTARKPNASDRAWAKVALRCLLGKGNEGNEQE